MILSQLLMQGVLVIHHNFRGLLSNSFGEPLSHFISQAFFVRLRVDRLYFGYLVHQSELLIIRLGDLVTEVRDYFARGQSGCRADLVLIEIAFKRHFNIITYLINKILVFKSKK